MKIYNKGIRPIVYKQDLTGTEVIQPGKFVEFSFGKKEAQEFIDKFENACNKDDYKKHLEELKNKAEQETEVSEKQASKKKK